MEATQAESTKKEAAKVTNDNTSNSTSRRNSSVITNKMIRLFLYLFNIPKACYLVESVIISLSVVEYGVLVLLMQYLTSVFKYSDVRAAVTVSIFYFVSGILAIFAELCKLRVGCYFMVQVNSISYIVALGVLLKVLKHLKTLQGSPDRKSLQALHGALFLLAVGRGIFFSTCTKDFVGAQMKKARGVSNEDNDKRDDIRSETSTIRAKIVGFENRVDCSENHPKAENTKAALGSSNQQSGIARSTSSLRCAGPICFTFLMYGIVYSTGETFFQDQAGSVDTSSAGYLKVSVMNLQIIAKTTRFFINHLVSHVLSRSTRTGTQATLIQMGLGMLFAIVTCSVAQYTEVVRLAATVGLSPDKKPDIGVHLFIPQFIALGFVTGCAGKGLEAFLENEYSNWIKTYATTITEVLTGLGFLLNAVFVLILRPLTEKLRGRSWFSTETPNKSRVDLYFHTLAVMCVLNFIPLYALASTCYYRKIKIGKFLLEGM
ncbi:hypothetical protein MKW94_003611 [Papaver nudicaule]|uniref:Uncharacterized protein n=1 Tax=Papaver nudicaule TaxID=74823 RepID=A0AA41VCU5_PAPNU|nr:hypothetical protein [Papaver nudicaule]